MKSISSLLTLSLLGLVACSGPESENLATQAEIPKGKVEIPENKVVDRQNIPWITILGGESQIEFNPKVDILFVIDNSDSMASAQSNLKKNIGRFTQGIRNNKMIDYNIGVISTWDASERAAKQKNDPFGIGELHYIKDANGKAYNKRFVSRKEGTAEVIASTIDIGILPFEKGGPENEEFFAPLMSAFEKSGPGAVNDGFFRDNSQLVVVLMTDADEFNNRYTPEQVFKTISDFKKGDNQKISVYGVLVRAEDPDNKKDWALRIHPKYHPECFNKNVNNGTCKPFGPKLLEEFVLVANKANGTPQEIRSKFLVPIVSDFGSELGRIGEDITAKTLEKTIYLEQRPYYINGKYQIRVRYGTLDQLKANQGQLIPEGTKGWTYLNQDASIKLSGHIQYQYVEGGQFAVDMQPMPTSL